MSLDIPCSENSGPLHSHVNAGGQQSSNVIPFAFLYPYRIPVAKPVLAYVGIFILATSTVTTVKVERFGAQYFI